jgi:hypothetical protein
MSKTSFKVDEIAETQNVCKKILVSKLLDYVRQHGKAATPKNCRPFHLEDGDGDHVLTVLDLGDSSSFTMQDKPGNPLRQYRTYCLYIIEDEYDRQWLMHFSNYNDMDGHVYFDNCNCGGEKHPSHESLLNESLAFVSAIADIVKTI